MSLQVQPLFAGPKMSELLGVRSVQVSSGCSCPPSLCKLPELGQKIPPSPKKKP